MFLLLGLGTKNYWVLALQITLLLSYTENIPPFGFLKTLLANHFMHQLLLQSFLCLVLDTFIHQRNWNTEIHCCGGFFCLRRAMSFPKFHCFQLMLAINSVTSELVSFKLTALCSFYNIWSNLCLLSKKQLLTLPQWAIWNSQNIFLTISMYFRNDLFTQLSMQFL